MQLELAHMNHFYASSLCNLAACLGGDSQSGLFQDLNSLENHECVVEVTSLGELPSRIKIANWKMYETAVDQNVLNTRAWVLQEVSLAPRIVYFTPQQMIWECAQNCFFETSPSSERDAGRHCQQSMAMNYPLTISAAMNDDVEIYRFWMEMVREFTLRRLTRKEDRLKAISAIARQVQKRLERKDEYFLGLWKKCLFLHLLWEPRQIHNPLGTEDESRPRAGHPSWSWASVDGPVYNHRTNREAIENIEPLAILEPRVLFAPGQDEFGFSQSAELDAIGPLLKVFSRIVYTKERTKDYPMLWLANESLEERRLLTKFGEVDLDVLLGPGGEGKSASGWVYCFFVGLEKFPESSKEQLVGLLLWRLGPDRGLYRRIGRFFIPQPRCDGLLEEMKTNWHIAEGNYLEHCTSNTYRITII